MEGLLALAVILAVPGYFLLQWYTARKLHGAWRLAALMPLLVMVPLIIHAAVAFAAQSNLWPLFVILVAPLACVYLIALAGLRSLLRGAVTGSAKR